MRLQDLAEMDAREMVQQVQEYFGDFIALEPHHFLVPLPRTHLAMQPFAWDFGNSSDAVARMTEGVASLVLSLRRRFLIRCVRWGAGQGSSGRRGCAAGSGASRGVLAAAAATAGCSSHTLLSAVAASSNTSVCRYQRGSEVCERFAQSLHHLTAIEERELFDFGSRRHEGEGAPVLLVLDRRDDPVTPLLSQWTYQVSGGSGQRAEPEPGRHVH